MTSLFSCICMSMLTSNSSGNIQKHGYLECFHAALTRENISWVWVIGYVRRISFLIIWTLILDVTLILIITFLIFLCIPLPTNNKCIGQQSCSQTICLCHLSQPTIHHLRHINIGLVNTGSLNTTTKLTQHIDHLRTRFTEPANTKGASLKNTGRDVWWKDVLASYRQVSNIRRTLFGN